MVIGTLFLAIAITCAGLTYYFLGLYQNIVWIWVPFVLAFVFYWAVFFVAIGTIGLLAELWKKSKKPDHPRPGYLWLLRQMCVQAMLFLRVRVHATGLGKLPEKENFMLVSNHLSVFDHIALNAALNRWPFIAVSKVRNFELFFAGGLLKKCGYLGIVQGDIAQGVKVIEYAGEILKQGKVSMAIAPEGTRNKDFPNPELLPFHPGSFAMAYASKKPIVVFAIQNTNAIFVRFPLHPTHVYLDCVGVIYYEEYKDMSQKELAEYTRSLIERRFEHKRARFYHAGMKKKEDAKAENQQ